MRRATELKVFKPNEYKLFFMESLPKGDCVPEIRGQSVTAIWANMPINRQMDNWDWWCGLGVKQAT